MVQGLCAKVGKPQKEIFTWIEIGRLWGGPQLISRETERFVLNAVSQNWGALEWASADLKGDREIVLKALSQNWRALEWASADLKGDREIVLNAVSQVLASSGVGLS